jgi:acyl carrier protein|tara:strand:- start:234 stop:470 length:237 start_codon:yes stop_codon:yes gene_type:complete
MENKLAERIKKVMTAVFEIPVGQIKDDSSPDTIESWDSLKHMNLVVALEEEFEIEFTDDEIMESMNFSLIQLIIDGKH